MNPIDLLYIASAAGALAFLGAGFLLGSSRVKVAVAATSEAREPPARFVGDPAPSDSIQGALRRIGGESRSADALLYDDEGLLVESTNGAVDDRIGAQVGIMAKSLASNRLGKLAPAEFQLEDDQLGSIRCRRVEHRAHGALWLATVAAKGRESDDSVTALATALRGVTGGSSRQISA